MDIPPQSGRTVGLLGRFGLSADCLRVPVNDRQGCNRAVGVWIRVRDPDDDGPEYGHQVHVPRSGVAVRYALGEQGRLSTVHGINYWTDSGDPVRDFRYSHGENLHFATVCFPAHVLHDEVSYTVGFC